MGAPKGNKFWQIRAKHGAPLIFESPELLWEEAQEYFEWCDKNPLTETDFKGKDATEVQITKMRPYTLMGLCLYLGTSDAYFRVFKQEQKDSKEQIKKDFLTVIARIEQTCYTQKFAGAAAGFLNHNIIARDLGLIDKQQVGGDQENPIQTNNTHTVIFKDMTKNKK